MQLLILAHARTTRAGNLHDAGLMQKRQPVQNVTRRWILKVTIRRCIAVLGLGWLCFVMTSCGGGASATTTPPPNNPPSAGVFQFSSSSLDFGSVNVGSSKSLTVSMSNTGGSQTGSVVTNDEIIAFALPKT